MQQLTESVTFLQERGITEPGIGIVLGTGLGGLVNEIDIEVEVAYTNIPHFPLATVEFHSGRLIYGKLGGKQVLAMNGRFHFYEGYSFQEVTFPIRVMKMLGIDTLLLSNAAGAMSLDRFQKGELMLIDDHINMLPGNPLIGPNLDQLGTRFPDMSEAYNNDLKAQLLQIAAQEGIGLTKGVYVSVMGPMLETPAEYRMLHKLGADAVGMSTVPEVIVANHMGMRCAAVSVLTDDCDPDNLEPVNIEDIIAIAGKTEVKLTRLFVKLVAELNV